MITASRRVPVSIVIAVQRTFSAAARVKGLEKRVLSKGARRCCEPFSPQIRWFASSPFDPTDHDLSKSAEPSRQQGKKRRRHRALKLVPLKPAVDMTPKAKRFFVELLKNPPRPDICGVRLNYSQSSSGEPRMVFSFGFVTPQQLEPFDEAVPLFDPPKQQQDASTESVPDNGDRGTTQPCLYVSGNAFLKVLGAKVDVDKNFLPVLYDKEGNKMDPNA